jgi:hypothetical protein
MPVPKPRLDEGAQLVCKKPLLYNGIQHQPGDTFIPQKVGASKAKVRCLYQGGWIGPSPLEQAAVQGLKRRTAKPTKGKGKKTPLRANGGRPGTSKMVRRT